jgi:branched-chain amino acid aminotransferase
VGHTSNSTLLVLAPRYSSSYTLNILDGPLSLEPSSTVLHYAQTIFEGMKAYRHESGRVTLFRPDMNMKRMLTSANRLALPVCTFSFLTLSCPANL